MEENLHIQPYRGILVLMYHRIDNTVTDPWNICVSTRHFEEQVRFLKSSFNIIRAEEIVDAVTAGNIPGNSICITFDDGYADNYFYAKPILEKYSCPAVFFIPTAFIGAAKPFWWDELEIILLHSKKLPSHLSLSIAGNIYTYPIKEQELTARQVQQHSSWKWYEEMPTSRCAAFLAIWEKLRPLPYSEIANKLDEIRKWAGSYNDSVAQRWPVNGQQLREMADNKLFTIGMHTHTHPDLQGKTTALQEEEILTCKNMLKNEYSVETSCLAYPYGRYDGNTLKAVNRLKISGCFTTGAAAVTTYSQPATLGRYQVCDWKVSELAKQMNNWITSSSTSIQKIE